MDNTFSYTINNEGLATITKYNGSSSSVAVPATLDGHPVVCIGKDAFRFCKTVTHLSLPEGITTIESNAFCGCDALELVELPDSLTAIGYAAFQYCSALTEIALPKGITLIRESTFDGCHALTDVILPDGITKIDKFAFWHCWKLKNINVPKSLQLVEYLAFGECESLARFDLAPDVQVMRAAFMDCFALGKEPSCFIPRTYKSEGIIYELQEDDTLFVIGYRDPRPYQRIQNSIRGHRTVKILPDALQNCSKLIELTIPEGVREIGSGAFRGCGNLRLIDLPASVINIGKGAIPNIGTEIFEDEQAAHWAGMQNDPWARKHYGLYDPIVVESNPGKVKVVQGSYAEQYCRENNIIYTLK